MCFLKNSNSLGEDNAKVSGSWIPKQDLSVIERSTHCFFLFQTKTFFLVKFLSGDSLSGCNRAVFTLFWATSGHNFVSFHVCFLEKCLQTEPAVRSLRRFSVLEMSHQSLKKLKLPSCQEKKQWKTTISVRDFHTEPV